MLNSAYERDAKQRAGIQSRLQQVVEHGVGSNVDASIVRWFSEDFRRRRPDQIRLVEERIRNNDRKGFLAAYRLFADSDAKFKGELGRITVPALVITGEDDVGSTPAMSRAIAAEIDGAELRVFAGVKHMLPVESAGKLADELIDFFTSD